MGAGVLESVSTWEKWKCSAETTHAPTPTHTPSHSPFLYCSFVHFCFSVLPPFAVWFSLINQNTYAGNTMSLCNLSPCPPPHCALHLFFCLFSSLPLCLSFPPKPIFFLDALYDLFALTFLFKKAHVPSFTHLVTSLLVNVQKQHLSP